MQVSTFMSAYIDMKPPTQRLIVIIFMNICTSLDGSWWIESSMMYKIKGLNTETVKNLNEC